MINQYHLSIIRSHAATLNLTTLQIKKVTNTVDELATVHECIRVMATS